jgi:hypothetical protein
MLFSIYLSQLSLLLLTATKSTAALRALILFLDASFMLACLFYFVIAKSIVQIYSKLPAFPSAIHLYKLTCGVVCSRPMERVKYVRD